MIRNYFTLEEMIVKYAGSFYTAYDVGSPFYQPEVTPIVTAFEYIVKQVFPAFFPSSGNPIKSSEANTLWCTYIVPVNKDQIITYIDMEDFDEPTNAELLKKYQKWMRLYIAIFNSTYDRYKKLIDTLENEKTHLMDEIKSSTFNKFNDTPQGSGDFSGDTHATTVNTSTTSIEGGTKLQRIAEIETLLKNYYQEWADEFGGLFINE